jgi:uncharacterized membrane protein YjjP (DUF1212 family)
MTPEVIFNIVAVVIVPGIVMLLKKINLPSKFAPVAAFFVATILVGIGKLIGIELDINSVADAIVKGLLLAGVSVIGYDQVKKITEVKK